VIPIKYLSYVKFFLCLFSIQQQASANNQQVLAIGFTGFINENSALCLFYHFDCLWYLIQLWDLE